MDYVDCVLGYGVECSDRLGVCLEGALGDDEIRKLCRDVDVGLFK